MKTQSFGELLKLLLDTSEEKAIVLAKFLKYDSSYLSKWLSDTRLPSHKCREQLVEDLCNFFIAPASPKLLQKFADALSLEIEPWELSDLRNLLWGHLSEQLKKTLEIAQPFVLKNDPNAILLSDRTQANLLVEDTIRRYCKGSAEEDVYFITTHPLSGYLVKNSVDDVSRKTYSIYENKVLHLSQFLECDDVAGCGEYCKIVLLYINHTSRVQYKLYAGKTLGNVRIMAIKNCVCSMEFYDNLLGRPYRCVTKAPEAVNDIFAQYQRLLDTQTLVFEYRGFAALSKQHYLSNFIMSHRLCCLLETMQLFFFPQELMELQPLYQHFSEDMRIFGEMLDSPDLRGNVRVIIYKSALLDYILLGKAGLFGQAILVSRQNRISHLEYLIDKLQHGEGPELCLLENQYAAMPRSDLDCSLYLNGTAMFAIKEGAAEGENDCCVFMDSGTIRSFERFFNNIWEECTNIAASTLSVIQFLQRGIEMIARLEE